MIYVENGVRPSKVEEAVLFPFDDFSIPFNKGLLLTLVHGRKTAGEHGTGYDPEHPDKPVVLPGKPGEPDCRGLEFYGTVIRIDGEYRMWYSGWSGEGRNPSNYQVCYAVSKDGVHWEKPKLGLVEYKGSTQNNLVLLDEKGSLPAAVCLVLYEPNDPDPNRRFKMLYEGRVDVAFSPDGLRWKSSPLNPVIRGIEPSGLIKFNGCYYVNGHGGPVPHPIKGCRKRMMVTFASYDFEHWTQAGHISFRRDNIPPRLPGDFESHRGEQVHMGASLWNRGNVILGFYGMYHNESNDRRTSTCDLGLVISNDVIHFKEPVPDFKIVPSYEEPGNAEPRLLQGEGFENIGDRTITWYSIWRAVDPNGPSSIRIATWPRDRLGYFSPATEIQLVCAPVKAEDAHFISCPITLDKQGAHVYVNADGLSERSLLKVEVLDEQFRPLPGYSGDDCIPITESGFRQPVAWRNRDTLEKSDQPIRICVHWGGVRPEDARVYAIYVS